VTWYPLKHPFKLLVHKDTHNPTPYFLPGFGCRAVRFEDVLILILTNRSSSVFSRFLYMCHHVGFIGRTCGKLSVYYNPTYANGPNGRNLCYHDRNLSSGKQGLVGWHGRSLQGGHVSECFSVNRGMVINPTFLVGVYYLQKNNPRKDFPSWRVRWVYPRQYLGCVIFSVISVSGFYHGKAPDFSPPCRGRFCWP